MWVECVLMGACALSGVVCVGNATGIDAGLGG